MTREEFVNDVMTAVKNKPYHIRDGQQAFNYIDEKYGVARTVQFNHNIDCFYDDSKIDEFVNISYDIWNNINKASKAKIYKHNKTGKLYSLVQTNLLFKDYTIDEVELDGYGSTAYHINKNKLEWRKPSDLVLYEALYDNPDGQFFVRHADDFFNNFTEID